MIEVAMATDDERETRRCPGTTVAGEPCRVPSEMLLDSGWCLLHDPARGAERSANATAGGNKTAKRMRKGIEVGDLNTPDDATRITARLAVALASGELPAAQGRAALVAVQAWLRSWENAQDDLVERLSAEIARLKGER